MKRWMLCLTLLVLGATLAFGSTVSAQPAPEFKLGFKALADQVPATVGRPLEDEHWGANGDSLQQTTTGLMVWRKADNWTAFTDGARTWINGPNGVESRSNNELFSWESPQPPIQPTATLQSQASATPQPAAAPRPVVPPTTTPLPIPTPPPAPTGYRFIDPNAIDSNPPAYVGQKVALYGEVLKHVYINGGSYIEFYPLSVNGTNLRNVQSFVVRFFPTQPGIEKGTLFTVYGTVTGMEFERTYVFGVPSLTFFVGIIGDHVERW